MWKLNGPGKFIQSVVEELQHGVSCIVDIPPFFPSDLILNVEKELNRDGRMHAVVVPPDTFDTDSEVQITKNLVNHVGLRVDDATDLNALVTGIRDYVFLYDSSNNVSCWKALKSWIVRFLRQVQQLPESERPTFFLTIPEHFAMIDNEIGLRHVSWMKLVRETDVRHFVDDIEEVNEANRFLNRVRKSIVVELGRTDLELVGYLCRFSLKEILAADLLLRRFRQESSWMREDNPFWDRQAKMQWDDREESHSCYLESTSQLGEIKRRIWKAQIVSVFPFLENRRCEIVQKVKDFLPKSFQSVTGETKDVESLELGEIMYELNKLKRPPPITSEVRQLRSIRHELAHLRPATYEMLCKVPSF
jgi:hypothetical protein